MIMSVFVFVAMLVAMSVRVLMRVGHVPVGVFVGMAVLVLVSVKMLVLVVALHSNSFHEGRVLRIKQSY